MLYTIVIYHCYIQWSSEQSTSSLIMTMSIQNPPSHPHVDPPRFYIPQTHWLSTMWPSRHKITCQLLAFLLVWPIFFSPLTNLCLFFSFKITLLTSTPAFKTLFPHKYLSDSPALHLLSLRWTGIGFLKWDDTNDFYRLAVVLEEPKLRPSLSPLSVHMQFLMCSIWFNVYDR